ncbi:winged helix-turn-helix transcriptional regulator [Bradyrhizobium sp. Arg314]
MDGRWKAVVLFHLLDAGWLRFNELRRRLPGITQRLLTKQLRELEAAGVVLRTVFAEVPPRVEYRVTDEGESLRPVMEMLSRWGMAWLERQRAVQASACQRRSSTRD